MTLRLAAFQHFCARFADAVLTSWSPLTYERGDYMDGTEKLDPDYEPECNCTSFGDPAFDAKYCAAHGDATVDVAGLKVTRAAIDRLGESLQRITDAEQSAFRSGGQTKQFGPRPRISTTSPSPTIIESAPPPPVGGDGPSEEIAAFPRRPSEGHPTVPAGSAPDLPAGISLPMFKASDLVAIAADYLEPYMRPVRSDSGDLRFPGRREQALHAAECVVSALTFELQSLAYDQSHPQT